MYSNAYSLLMTRVSGSSGVKITARKFGSSLRFFAMDDSNTADLPLWARPVTTRTSEGHTPRIFLSMSPSPRKNLSWLPAAYSTHLSTALWLGWK